MTTFNANTTNPPDGRHVYAEELLFVLEGWKGQDDWGVETYPYPDTCLMLLECLHAGDNPRALKLLAKLSGGDWKYQLLIALCPTYKAHEDAERTK